MKRFLLFAILSATLLLSACSFYKNDKCWISDSKYKIAKEYYQKTGSLDLTQQFLEEKEWMNCEINEAKYRIIKEFDLE